MALRRLSLIRGDNNSFGVTFKRADGTLYNIKNWVVFFTLKTNPSLADADASLQVIVSAFTDTTSGTSGSANIPIVPADTTNLMPGEYDFDVQVCTNESKNYTVLRGKCDIGVDITRSAGTAGTA